MKSSKRFPRSLLFLVLIAALCGGMALPVLAPVQAAPVKQVAINVVFSEFRTRGSVGGNDEFIELFNPTLVTIDISGWTVRTSSGCGTITNLLATIPNSTSLNPGEHYLATGFSYSGSVIPDYRHPSNWAIDDSGGIAIFDSAAILVDQVGMCSTTTYLEGNSLPSLASALDQSYERNSDILGSCVDSNNNLSDFFLRNQSSPQNLSNPIVTCGDPTPTPTVTSTSTPTNTATVTNTPTPINTGTITRTPTVSRTPTLSLTPTRVPTQTLPPTLAPQPRVAINEFVPRPGHDWNNDGLFNVADEYIEIINHGTISVDLDGYTLDDEVNLGSDPYSLPSVTLDPGERIVFYGSETGLLLSDGGDGVRLLSPNGQLVDAFNYTVVNYPDQAYCRLPDNGGLDDWNRNCFPTPGLRNTLSGNFVNPSGNVNDESLCPIADTLPNAFILAECQPFGHNIWRPAYWDDTGWYGEQNLPDQRDKWNVFVD